MKKLVFGFLATILFTFAGNAQTERIALTPKFKLEDTFGPLVNVTIPNAQKSTSKTTTANTIMPIFIPKQNGWAIVEFNENGIISIKHTANMIKKSELNETNNLNERYVSPYRRCEKASSDLGTLMCAANVLSEWIINMF